MTSKLQIAEETISCYSIVKIENNVYCIEEKDPNNINPLMYLIIGETKAALIDTGVASGNLWDFISSTGLLPNKMKIIVINTNNHYEKTSANYQFSTTGKHGLALNCEALCASGANKNYTRLMTDSTFKWQVKTYKVTRWLKHNETIHLGDETNPINKLEVWLVPGITPDSLILFYRKRFFLGDLYYDFADINLSYEYSSLKMYVQSFSKLISQLKSLQAQKGYENIRFSSSKNDKDNCCVPTLKNFQHFLLGLVTGAQKSIDTGINELKFETRDKVCRVIVSRRIYEQLKKARVKKVQYNSSVTLSVHSDLMSTASK